MTRRTHGSRASRVLGNVKTSTGQALKAPQELGPDQKEFWDLFIHYCPRSGEFTWRHREKAQFDDIGRSVPHSLCAWNKKYAGKRAGSGPKRRVIVEVLGNRIAGHRLAWWLHYGELPRAILDHINGDPTDNRIDNLRLATHQQNMCNRRPMSGGSSKYLGVYREPDTEKFRASVRSELGTFRSRRFKSEDEAARAYNIAAKALHGEFARLNVIGKPGETVSVAESQPNEC